MFQYVSYICIHYSGDSLDAKHETAWISDGNEAPDVEFFNSTDRMSFSSNESFVKSEDSWRSIFT